MRKFISEISLKMVWGICSIVFLVVAGNLQVTKAEDVLTVEGEWEVISTNDFDINVGDRYTVVREGSGYDIRLNPRISSSEIQYIATGLYNGTTTQITVSVALTYDDLAHIYKGTGLSAAALGEWADKIIKRYQFTLSADGRSAIYANDKPRLSQDPRTGRIISYEIIPYAYKTHLKRISGPTTVENRSDRAYQADCGPVDPKRATPITTDLCPGNLVAMTYFCGGGTSCPYVCCPKGLPYLNHCDCKCYATADFECHSYSKAQEQPRQ